jgi:hypothetical protein
MVNAEYHKMRKLVIFYKVTVLYVRGVKKLWGRLLESSHLEDRVPLLTKNNNNTKVDFKLIGSYKVN